MSLSELFNKSDTIHSFGLPIKLGYMATEIELKANKCFANSTVYELNWDNFYYGDDKLVANIRF